MNYHFKSLLSVAVKIITVIYRKKIIFFSYFSKNYLEISPEYLSEGLMLKLKLQYFGHLMWRNWLLGKDPDAGKDWRQEEETTEVEMVGWHHQLDGHEFEQAPGAGDRQGSLVCCISWGRKELDTTEWQSWTEELLINFFWLNIIPHSVA